MTAHRPDRKWLCEADGEPWPCAGAKSELFARYDGVKGALMAEMTARYSAATVVLLETPTQELYERFTGWIAGFTPAEGAEGQ